MNAAKRRVLVVEDDEDSRNALCSILDALGYEFLAFASGRETLEAIQGEALDIALLDIMMPEMNGYELMEEIKKIPAFQSMPVIMVTAKDQDAEIIEGYKHGVDYYIPKPFNSEQIEYGIQLFLDDHQPKSS